MLIYDLSGTLVAFPVSSPTDPDCQAPNHQYVRLMRESRILQPGKTMTDSIDILPDQYDHASYCKASSP